MRRLLLTVLYALVAASAGAQDLERPGGWSVRFDQPGASEEDLRMFVAMPPGWHVTSGPAAIYWGPNMSASGDFRLEMEVFLFDPEGRREAFGLFFGGRGLEGAEQSYTYFLIRDGRQFIIKRRSGSRVPTIRGWTGHEAISGYADRGAEEVSVRNVLAVEATSDVVRFFVNGVEVDDLPRSELGVEGTFGFRVNHGLNLHVSRLEASPLG
jgi:hypothetical protein